MPWMMRLTADGVAIHGSKVERGFCTNGCIGVPDEFAKRLFRIATLGDKVIITDGKRLDIGQSILHPEDHAPNAARSRPLPRRHADRAVEPDRLPVEIGIAHQFHRKAGVFLGPAKALGKRDRSVQPVQHLFRQAAQQRGIEMPSRIALTRMPRSIRSRAIGSTRPTTPAFSEPSGDLPICASCAATEAVSTINPRWPSSMGSSAAMPSADRLAMR